MAQVFLSYSHKDEQMRNELEIHLALLKRQGIVEVWHDQRILGGDDFPKAISLSLEESDIILLLISPYFLASDYCFDVEMARALQRHEEGSARVVPVIIDPCDWKNSPFKNLKALPKDGKAISKYSNFNDAFLEVVEELRRIISSNDSSVVPVKKNFDTSNVPRSERFRSSNLAIKRSFSDHEKDEFLNESYSFVRNFFEESLNELKARNTDVNFRLKDHGGNRFSTEIYVSGKAVSSCTIWLNRSGFMGNGISMANQVTDALNTINSSLTVADDGHQLSLKALMMSFTGCRENDSEGLTQHGAAEYYWANLIAPLQ